MTTTPRPSQAPPRVPPDVRVGLTARVSLAITLVIGVVLVVHSYGRMERESALFDDDTRRDHATLALALAMAAERVAEHSGTQEGMRVIEAANHERATIEIHFKPVDGPAPQVDHEIRSTRLPGSDGDAPEVLATTVGLRLGDVWGHIELEEELVGRAQYLEQTLVRTVAFALVLILLCGVSVFVTVWSLLGRRMGRIIERIHQIGEGKLEGSVGIQGSDEIALFARELDQMCADLQASQQSAAREFAARELMLEQLRHADRLSTVGKLASGVAHELGTPLNVISARAKMILEAPEAGAAIREDAEIIRGQAERMTRIIRQLLDFARARGLRRAPTALRPLIAETLAILEPLARKRGVELGFSAPAGEKVANVDGAQFQQVLMNLVMNAIQASPQGERVEVTLQPQRRQARQQEQGEQGQAGADADDQALEQVSLAVQDRGTGMPEAVRERVFEPFFTTKDVGEGTGLGLSISYGIVMEHGGVIMVDSAVGQGSCFTVRIPVGAP